MGTCFRNYPCTIKSVPFTRRAWIDGAGGAHSALVKSGVEAKADQLGLRYEKGKDGAGGLQM